MTRKEYETICRVIKEAARHPNERAMNVSPIAEWMRMSLANRLATAFNLDKVSRAEFIKACGITGY